MGLGSQNTERRKTFQKVAGGTRWRSKVDSAAEAQRILDTLEAMPVKDEYTKSKITELQQFVTFKQGPAMRADGGDDVFCKDCGAKIYEEDHRLISLKEFNGMPCETPEQCRKP